MTDHPGDMVQIHMLTSYPATLLNRDDTGLAKRIPFGEVVRTRISSQCLKKHWREAAFITDLGNLAHRSTRIYEQFVADVLVNDHGAGEEVATAIAEFLISETIDTQPVEDSKGRKIRTGQVVVLTNAEVSYLSDLGAQILKELGDSSADVSSAKDVEKRYSIPKDIKANLRELPASLDTALFGRMVTSDLFARVDAAVSVAHAFTTHPEASETDYFTAIDTLSGDEPGAGLIQDTELTTGVYYLYSVIDMNQLRSNLGAEADAAEKVAANLVRAMATVTPGAKRGSTAPYSYAELILLERGSSQPRTLANAFRQPIEAAGSDVMMESVTAMLNHRSELLNMYGLDEDRVALSTIHPVPEGSPPVTTLEGALEEICEAEAPSA